jgi:hypothetical protein
MHSLSSGECMSTAESQNATESITGNVTGNVSRRRVFYIPGYDPHPPRRYRELYRKEAARQAGISGYDIALTGRAPGAQFGWQVQACIDGQKTTSEFEVLVWSDLVADSMQTGIAATYWQLLYTAWTYVVSGALRQLMRLRKGPVIAALYPVGMLVGQGVVALALAWLAGGLAAALAGVFTRAVSGTVTGAAVTVPGAGWVAALPVVVLVLRWFRRIDGRLYAYYLMHDYAFVAQSNGANPPDLDRRILAFGARIRQALDSDVDEVLVVAHSSGVQLAVHALAALTRERGDVGDGPALAFLSLGQVVPMVSFLPGARRLRADLHDLSLCKSPSWVDVSAPGDGCSFALCDPVAVSGVAPANKRWPLVISAAFTQTLSPARWQALKRRYFRLHFQYLCAFDRPGDYDYFQITAGPLTLERRYAGRAPSKSRIDVAASPHRTMLA